jgi:hypothetical protein
MKWTTVRIIHDEKLNCLCWLYTVVRAMKCRLQRDMYLESSRQVMHKNVVGKTLTQKTKYKMGNNIITDGR